MASPMVSRGTDVRYIQAMLGHASLSTTQIYTHVSIRRLHEVDRQSHPAKAQATPVATPTPHPTT